MATIADLVIGAGFDVSDLDEGVRRGVQIIEQLEKRLASIGGDKAIGNSALPAKIRADIELVKAAVEDFEKTKQNLARPVVFGGKFINAEEVAIQTEIVRSGLQSILDEVARVNKLDTAQFTSNVTGATKSLEEMSQIRLDNVARQLGEISDAAQKITPQNTSFIPVSDYSPIDHNFGARQLRGDFDQAPQHKQLTPEEFATQQANIEAAHQAAMQRRAAEDKASATQSSLESANAALATLNKAFDSGVEDIRERLFRGLLNSKEAERETIQLGKDINASLAGVLDKASAQNVTGAAAAKLTSDVVKSFKSVGLKEIPSAADEWGLAAIKSLNERFEQGKLAIRDQLFRGVFDRGEAEKKTKELAQEINRDIAKALDNKPAGISQSVVNKFIESYKDIGTKAGNAFNDQFFHRLEKGGRGLENAGRSLSLFVTGPIVAAFAGLTAAGSAVDDAFATIKKNTGLIGSALSDVNSQFIAVSKTVPNAMNEVAEVTSDVNRRLGATGEVLRRASKDFLDFARVEGESAPTVTRDLARAMNALGVNVNQLRPFLDRLTVASQQTGIKFSAMARELEQSAPSFKLMGIGLDQSIALFALFEKEGVKPAEVLQSLNIALKNLAKHGAVDANGALGTLIQRIRDAKTPMEAVRLSTEAFGRGGAQMAAKIRSGRLDVEALVNVLRHSDGAFTKTADSTLTFGDNMKILRNELTIALYPLGVQIIEAFRKYRPAIEEAIASLGRFVKNIADMSPASKVALAAFLAIAAGVGPMLIGLGRAIVAFVGVRNAIVALQGKEVLVGLLSKFGLLATYAAPVVILLGSLALVLHRSGEEARKAAEDVDKYKQSLYQFSQQQLINNANDLIKQISHLRAEQDAASKSSLIRVDPKSGRRFYSEADQTNLLRYTILIDAAQKKLEATNRQIEENGRASAAADRDTKSFLDNLNNSLKGLFNLGDVPALTNQRKSPMDLLREQVDRAIERVQVLRDRSADITKPLKDVSNLHAEIERRIEAEGGALKANADLLGFSNRLLQTLQQGDAGLDRAKTLAGALATADDTQQGINKALRAARDEYARLNRLINEGTNGLKVQNNLLAAARALREALHAHDSKLVADANRVTSAFDRAEKASSLASNAFFQKIQRQEEVLSAAVEAAGGLLMAPDELAGELLRLRELIRTVNDRVGPNEPGSPNFQEAPENALPERFRAIGEAIRRFEKTYDDLRFENKVRIDEIKRQFREFGVVLATYREEIKGALIRLVGALSPDSLIRGIGSGFASLFNYAKGVFTSIIGEIKSRLAPSLAPLESFFNQLATIVGNSLAPVFKALAPVLQQLLPVVQAFLQVLAPLIQAMIPILKVVIELLRAAFPVIKAVAIIATYLGQALFTLAGIVLKIAAFILNAIGAFVKALGKFINAIVPFANPGNPLVKAGEGMQSAAQHMLNVAGDFSEISENLGKAREEIKKAKIEDSLGNLGDAANNAAENLFNVPNTYRLLGLRRVQSEDAFSGAPAVATGSEAKPNVSGSSTTVYNNYQVTIDARDRTASELFDMVSAEGNRRARQNGLVNTAWSM